MPLALITGAASLIGEGIARALAAEGWQLALTDLNLPLVQSVADGLPRGAVAMVAKLDVTDAAEIERVVALAAERAGGIDALGAGYAGLTSFTLLEPDIVKLDMALVRDIHRQPKKQTLVKTMVTMCKELDIVVTSEGIEVPEERDELARVGCDLMQGYLFAKPGDAFPVPVY